jgi:hypothetical protein
MSETRFRPNLRKRLLRRRGGQTFYSANGFAIRNAAQPSEEFTNFALPSDFPHFIPEGQVWISQEVARREADFFIANALVQLERVAAGKSADSAYASGLDAERKLRAERLGIKYRAGRPHKRTPKAIYARPYLTLDDPELPIAVWLVDGCMVRSIYKTDFTEGGHGWVYPWCPKNQIWIEKDLQAAEAPFILTHEYMELRLMRDEKIDYDRAHEMAAELEFDLRKSDQRKSFPGLSRKSYRKADLGMLTKPEFFEYVKSNYEHGLLRRARALIADALEKVLP